MTDKSALQERTADVWAGPMGDKWLRHVEQFESMMVPVGEGILAAAGFTPGEKVVDIGCGGGTTSLEIARRVGEGGHVLSLDISQNLLARAQQRATEAGLDNIQFMLGDASKARLHGENFDCLFSRFGVMFFTDPYAGFAHMKGFLRPGGRMVFACWAPKAENRWATELLDVAARYVELPQTDPRAPGPFAFGDPDYVRDILAKAGFVDISLTGWQGDQLVGGAGATLQAATRFAVDGLFVGELLEDEPADVKARATADIEKRLAKFQTERGIILPAKAWFVEARA